jgi:signal transduction histidine kinase/DNA-binding response OmpR family regulator
VLCIAVQAQGQSARNLAHALQQPSATIDHPGLSAAHRLVDRCQIEATDDGLLIALHKLLPKNALFVTAARQVEITKQLVRARDHNPMQEIQRQNQELIQTLEALRERQEEMARLNRELEDTNRGVVALYAELDEKAEHLRRADEMKSRFLSNMSHEFRTPLNSILALARLLLDRLDGELTSEQEKQVAFIRKAATDLAELVNDLLDLAKIEAGKIEIRPAEFTVASLFSALRGMLRPLLVSTTVDLIFEEVTELPPLYTDESKVSQILRNFLSNALKFTEQGEVRVCACLSADGQSVIFAVSDTGIGIPAAHHADIFSEFVQVENPLQKRVKGTGLGLPLCRKLAELLGGTVTMTSILGAGSTFRATIPLRYCDPIPALVAPESATPPDPAQPVVLVVEDNEELLFVYERYLANTEFRFVAARTLREARRQLEVLRPHAILLDILLPDEAAWNFLAELKNRPATAAIPVLVVTTEEDQQKGLALGADAYGIKPVTRAWLLAELARVAPTTVERILLIEDQAEMRYLFRKLLTGTPYLVLDATDGAEGLQRVQSEQPQIICLDLMLPQVDGFQVLAQLKADPATQQIPILIVTAKTLTADEERRLATQALVLSKADLSQAALLAALRQVRGWTPVTP